MKMPEIKRINGTGEQTVILNNSRNSGQVSLSARDGLSALMMADRNKKRR